MNVDVTNTIVEYLKTKPVDKAWLFGSFARNEEHDASDVDIMVALSPDIKMGLSFYGMMVDLEKKLNRSVDMVREGHLMPFAEKSAMEDRILIYEREH